MAAEDLAARQTGGTSGSRGVLFVGLALGVVAAVLIALILSSSEGGEKIVPATRVAVVARADIPARTRITREMLEVKTYGISDVDSDAYTSVAQLTNRVTSEQVKAGEVLVPSLVSATTGQGLNFTVSPGMRAVSIGVSEVVIAGGNLSPGNYVDIIGVFKVAQGGDVTHIVTEFTGTRPFQPLIAPSDSRLTFTILQNVRILAVAQDLPKTETPSGGGSVASETEVLRASRANPKAGTVTLEVTPQQAQVMSIADIEGDLRLSLRPFGESDVASVNPIIVLIDN